MSPALKRKLSSQSFPFCKFTLCLIKEIVVLCLCVRPSISPASVPASSYSRSRRSAAASPSCPPVKDKVHSGQLVRLSTIRGDSQLQGQQDVSYDYMQNSVSDLDLERGLLCFCQTILENHASL